MWPLGPVPLMPFPPIIVTDKVGAGVLLTEPDYRREIKWVISMGGQEPKGLDKVSPKHKLRLTFDDIDRPVRVMPHLQVPTMADVEAITTFAGRAFMGNILIHCAAGQSRSAAAALLVLATQMGPGWEDETVRTLRSNVAEADRQHLRPPGLDIHPNRLLVWLGDRALGRQGLLWHALVRHMGESYLTGFYPPAE